MGEGTAVDLLIKSHNHKLSDELREYIESHAGKVDRVNERITEAKFEVREDPSHRDGQRYTVQFTIATKRSILRAEERGTDLRAAIDIVIDKMNRQIRRFHERRIKRNRRDAVGLGVLAADTSVEQLPETDGDDRALDLLRTKRFKVQPMDVAEAIEQIDLLGHDFFVFYNAEVGQLSVLYRRRDSGYGLIVPELA